MDRLDRVRSLTVILILAAAVGWFFFLPGWQLSRAVFDPGLSGVTPPRAAFFWHRALAPRYEAWARSRVASGSASHVEPHDISGTEWPVFGSVFFLLASEGLQTAWADDPALAPEAPAVYARGAVDAAAALIMDPAHGAFVRARWGDGYLHRENLFYRTLLILGASSYERLTGDLRYRSTLADQVETLSAEMLAAPHFVLDDYPGECYPCDVLWAIAAIHEADALLRTDHSAVRAAGLKALDGPLLHPLGIPPYFADSRTGGISGESRGCGNSALLIYTPELDLAVAQRWYAAYEKHYWQRAWLFDGFREFPKGGEGRMNVDSGPIVAGHGVAACAFGIGAARANGRFDHARVLSLEAMLFAWPLPDGTLLVPRALSNATDAPLLGEAALLFCLTRRPILGASLVPAAGLSPACWILLVAYWLSGVLLLCVAVRHWRAWRRGSTAPASPRRLVAGVWSWILLVAAAATLFPLGHGGLSALAMLVAIVIPERIRGSRSCSVQASR